MSGTNAEAHVSKASSCNEDIGTGMVQINKSACVCAECRVRGMVWGLGYFLTAVYCELRVLYTV